MGISIASAMTKQLHKDIRLFAKQLKQDVGETQKQIAVFAANQLLKEAPFWTGTYIKSFRAKIGAVDGTAEPYDHGTSPFPDTISTGEAEALKERQRMLLESKINKAIPFAPIKISNSLDYADRVEYVGWPEYSSPPYYVFTIAQMNTAGYCKTLVALNVGRGGHFAGGGTKKNLTGK